ncbi:MAG: MvdC/MvdD family ATP grasp protein, partial [Chloroflexota bacterium]
MTNPKQILIVTRAFDPHADDMITVLRYMDHSPIRLNTEYLPTQSLLSLAFNTTGWHHQIILDGRIIDSAHIHAVWWRRPAPFQFPEGLSIQEIEFARAETRQALYGFWESMDCRWISHPYDVAAASNLLGQFQRAHRLGFDIPPMIITTNPAEAEAFFYVNEGQVSFRIMSDPTIITKSHDDPSSEYTHHATPTTPLEESHLTMLDSICAVPCLFQRTIPLTRRWYVVIIGSQLFAVEASIETDAGKEQEKSYRRAMLPAPFAKRCLALARSYQLHFCVTTLAQDTTGQWWFMEQNPIGQ